MRGPPCPLRAPLRGQTIGPRGAVRGAAGFAARRISLCAGAQMKMSTGVWRCQTEVTQLRLSGEQLFITQAIEHRRTIICLNRRTGELLWQAGPTWTEGEQTPPDNPACTTSPVTDGRRVIAWF